MEEVSPWSRLGFGTTRNVEENKELLLLRDQVIELSKQLADLTLRLERIERVNASEEKPIENVFAVADYSDFFGEETEDAPVVENDVDDGITRVKVVLLPHRLKKLKRSRTKISSLSASQETLTPKSLLFKRSLTVRF